jgi:hypothetical protein
MVKRSGPGRPRSEVKRRPQVSLKMEDDYKAWLDKLAASCRLPLTLMYEQAVQEYAEKRNFRPPPKR